MRSVSYTHLDVYKRQALAGAQDIIAEAVSDDAACRAELRRYYRAFGRVASAKAKDEDSVYAQYYDLSLIHISAWPFCSALCTSLMTAVFRPLKLTLYLPSTWGTGSL